MTGDGQENRQFIRSVAGNQGVEGADRNHPDTAFILEGRVVLVAGQGRIGQEKVAAGVEANGIRNEDRTAVDLLEEGSMPHVNLAERLAVGVEDQQVRAHPIGVRDDLPVSIPHRRVGHAGKNGPRGKRRRIHRQYAHAQAPGQAGDELVVDHRQLTRRLHFELADVGFALAPGKTVRPRRALLGGVGDEHESSVGTENGAFRVVKAGDDLLDDRRNRMDLRMRLTISRAAYQHRKTNDQSSCLEIERP